MKRTKLKRIPTLDGYSEFLAYWQAKGYSMQHTAMTLWLKQFYLF